MPQGYATRRLLLRFRPALPPVNWRVTLACTRYWFSVHREPPLLTITDHWKTAIAYSCPLTPEFAKAHEREHLKGELHP